MLNKLTYIALRFAGLLVAAASSAQMPSNKPSTLLQVNSPASVASPPAFYTTGAKINYVRTREAIEPLDDEAIFNTTKPYTSVKELTQYLDGLGRPFETVSRQASGGSTPKDIVSPIVYDAFGREVLKYLPYAQTTGTQTADGRFKTDPLTDQASFYSSTTYNPSLQGEQVYYGKTEYEASQLNRVTKTMAPGNNWAGSSKGVSMDYRINDTSDAVRMWNITNSTVTYDASKNIPATLNIPTTAFIRGTYAEGQLFETETSDEQGNKVVEYKDKEGNVILKKVQIDADVSVKPADVGWLCTYYIYDVLGQLRFVVPPKAVKWLSQNTWSFSSSGGDKVVAELCFRYEYDGRQRMIAKKVPGAGWVYMVYDKRDRLVYTQDANMRRFNRWMATLYDDLNRPRVTGMMAYYGGAYYGTTYSNDRDGLQKYTDASFANTVANGTSSSLADPSFNSREVGRGEYKATNSITFNPEFVSEVGANFIAEIEPAEHKWVQNDQMLAASNFTPLTITYYDKYNTSKSYNNGYNGNLDYLNDNSTSFPEAKPNTPSTLTRGMVTGKKVRVLEDPNNLAAGEWMETVPFYDDKGRLIQAQSENYKRGLDIVTTLYDFSGKVLTTYSVHNNPVANQTVRVKTNMLYDHAGRVLEVKKTINDDPNSVRSVARNTYDEMGQLKDKALGQQKVNGLLSSNALETLSFEYNIRGWLKGINRAYNNKNTSQQTDRWFGMDLSYDWGFEINKNQFNGNIAGVKWRSRGDGELRAYGFGYDATNRLLYGDFSQHNGSNFIDKSEINFDMMMGDGNNPNSAYDENGNILQMQQWGLKINSSPQIDNLLYGYNDNSNKLKNVRDQFNDEQTRLGDFRTSANHYDKWNNTPTRIDYTYDENGNLKKDLNKDIGEANVEGIIYNQLNLPWKITVKNKGTITYIYDATGNKLEKRKDEPAQSKNTKTAYIGGYIYENDKLQFFSHEEGRVRLDLAASPAIEKYKYDYFIKDHLGNVRMVLTDEKRSDVYPPLSLEGTPGSGEVDNQNKVWEKADGTAFDVAGKRTTQSNLQNYGGNPPPSTYSLLVRSSTGKVGAAKLLKVMSGDKLHSTAQYYYHENTAPGTTNGLNTLVSSLAAALTNSVAASHGLKANASALSNAVSIDPNAATFFAQQSSSTNNGRPKAFLNVLFFDEQFKMDANASYSQQIKTTSSANPGQEVVINRMASKSGYCYVYISNETNDLIYFDNVTLTHDRGALLEETHYYPFGLTMSGISSKAAGKLENKYKFGDKELQSHEFSDEYGLDMYDFGQRNYDHQIGRWWQIDPMSEARNWVTPFNYVQNNPITRIDPDGAFDDYFIRDNGEISVKKTDDAFDRFYTQKSERTEGDMVIRTYKLEAKLDKNEDGLIALPNSFQGDGFGFKYTGSKDENYISGAAFAGLVGALKEAQISDVSLNHWSNADGSSPSPSRSHKNGEVGDIRPLRKDESGNPVLITDKQFDAERNATLMKSMKKFGWTSVLSERNPSTGQITPGTTHYSGYTDKNGNWKSVRHNNHYHAQKFHPKLIPYKPYKR